MNIANVMQAMPNSKVGLFGSNVELASIESPFQLLLEQRIEVPHLNNEQLIPDGVNSEDAFQELQQLLSILLQFTEDDVAELFGNEAAEKLYPEILSWQRLAEEPVSNAELVNSLLAIFQLQIEPNKEALANKQSLQLQPLNEQSKSLILRLLYLFSMTGTEQRNATHEQMQSQIKSQDKAMDERTLSQFQKQQDSSPSRANVSQIKKILGQAIERKARQTASPTNHLHEKYNNNEEQRVNRVPTQQNVSLPQAAMERIHQLEFRIQLLSEMDSATLTKQFEKILASSQMRTFKNGLTQLQVRLHPDHLGSLSVRLTQLDGQLIARITAQTDVAKNLIESQLHQLRQAFVTQNIQVDRIEVFTQENEQQQQSNPQSNEEKKDEHEAVQQSEQEERAQDEEEQSFKEWLESLIL